MISYIGGKSVIGKWIRDYIPEDIETYVEPFGGMFWVFFCLDLDKYKNLKNIVYNDYNKLNANLFECVSEDYKKLGEILNNEPCQKHKEADTPDEVEHHRNTFNKYQKEIFDDDFVITEDNKFEVAKKYAFVLTQIFSGSQPEKSKYIDFKGKYKPKFRTFREKLTDKRYAEFQKKLKRINFVKNMDYSEVIKKYDSPTTYFYVDPPYWKTENYYSKHDFDRDDHEKLCTQLKTIKGKFGLSYYDFDKLNEWLPEDEYTWNKREFTKQAGTKKDGSRDKGEELLIIKKKRIVMNNKPEQIKSNYDKLMLVIGKYFEGDQYDNIKLLFDHFEDRIIEAPASGRPSYHNCFMGGWLDHTLRVIETSLKMREHFVKIGVEVTATEYDVVLAAMFHDLGKLGDLNDPYYKYQTDEWRRNKLQEWYTYNPDMENMSVTDRALWLLQHFNIKVSEEVWKAIKLSDGMFDKGNEDLYRRSTDSRNVLHYIVHFGDWMSTVAEKQHYIQGNIKRQEKIEKVTREFDKQDDKEDVDNLKQKFNELFA